VPAIWLRAESFMMQYPVQVSAPFAGTHPVQRQKMFTRCNGCVHLQGAIMVHHSSSSLGEKSTAPTATTGCRLDNLGSQALIEILDQFPRPPIGHPQRPASSGNRARLGNFLQYRDLARTDLSTARQIDPNAEPITSFGRFGGFGGPPHHDETTNHVESLMINCS
jgi:hypothetical protein